MMIMMMIIKITFEMLLLKCSLLPPQEHQLRKLQELFFYIKKELFLLKKIFSCLNIHSLEVNLDYFEIKDNSQRQTSCN